MKEVHVVRLLCCFMMLANITKAQEKTKLIFPPPVLSDHYPSYIDACQVLKKREDRVYTRFLCRSINGQLRLASPSVNCKIDLILDITEHTAMSTKITDRIRSLKKHAKRAVYIDIVGMLSLQPSSKSITPAKFVAEKIWHIQFIP